MDILKLGAELLMSKVGAPADTDAGAVQDALGSLIGQGDSLDIGSLVDNLKSDGLGELAMSWLGDGSNSPISIEQLTCLLDMSKLGQLTSLLGSDQNSVLAGLQDVIPQMVDKSSSGGNLLGGIDDIAGAANVVKGLFGGK